MKLKNNTLHLMFCLYLGHAVGELIFIDESVTLEKAWNTCHNYYKGYLTNINGSNRSEDDSLASNEIWNGSYRIPLNWISYEGCYEERHEENVNFTSVAQCQIKCGSELNTYFAVGISFCLCKETIDDWNATSDQQRCNTSCDNVAICGSKSHVSVYKNVKANGTVADDSNLCLSFKCTPGSDEVMEYIAKKCDEPSAYRCGQKDKFHNKKTWKDFITTCTYTGHVSDTVNTDICKHIFVYVLHPRWTSIIRVIWQFQDNENTTLEELRAAMKYNEMENTTHPFLCEGVKLFNNTTTQIEDNITTGQTESQQAQITDIPRSDQLESMSTVFCSDPGGELMNQSTTQRKPEDETDLTIAGFVVVTILLALIMVACAVVFKTRLRSRRTIMKSIGTQVYSMHTSVDVCTQYVSQDALPIENCGHFRKSELDIESTNSSINNGIDRTYFVLETSSSHRILPRLPVNTFEEQGTLHTGNKYDEPYHKLEESSINRDFTDRSASVQDTVICETQNSETKEETNECDSYNNTKNTYFVLEKRFNAEGEPVLSKQQDFNIDIPQCLEKDVQIISDYCEINDNTNMKLKECLPLQTINSQSHVLAKEQIINTFEEHGAPHTGNKYDELYHKLEESSINRDFTDRSASVQDTVICETQNSETKEETNECDSDNNTKNTYFVLEKRFNAEGEPVLSKQQDFNIDIPQCLEKDVQIISDYCEINDNTNMKLKECLPLQAINSQSHVLAKEQIINTFEEHGAPHTGNKYDELYHKLEESSINRDFTDRSASVQDTVICETQNSETKEETNECDSYNNTKNTYFVLEKRFNAEEEPVLSKQQDFNIDIPQCLEKDVQIISDYCEINDNTNMKLKECLPLQTINSQSHVLAKEQIINTEQEEMSMSVGNYLNESSYFVLEKQFASEGLSWDAKVPVHLKLCSDVNEYSEIEEKNYDHLHTTHPRIMQRKDGNAYDHIK